MAGLNFSGNYLNPYEAARNQYSGTPLYKELGGDEAWSKMSKEGQLNSFISVLHDGKNLSPIKLEEDYGISYLKNDEKFTAVANELYGDRETMNTYDETTYDAQGNAQVTPVQMSEYDWNKKLLKQNSDYYKQQHEYEIARAKKDELNGFVKFLGTLATPVSSAVRALAEMAGNVLSLTKGLADAGATLIQGGNFEEADTALNDNFNENIFAGVIEDINNFESNYTYLRDVDGTPSNALAEVTISLSESFGQAGLSMIGNVIGANIGGTFGKAISSFSNFTYWYGMSANAYADMINDPAYASVPTYQKLINSSAKALAEYLVMKGLNKLLGPTSADKLVFGYKGGSVSTSVGNKIFNDFLHEGTEEALQELADYFVDNAMSVMNENFGKNSNFSFETMSYAFILGGISSVGMSALDIIVTPNLQTNEVLTDKSGNIKVDKDGNPRYRKFSKAKSWILSSNINTFLQNTNELINNNKLSETQRKQAFEQAYVTMRNISTVYNIIGPEKFASAQQFLSAMIAYAPKSSFTAQEYRYVAQQMLKEFDIMQQSYQKAALKNLTEKVADAKMTKVKAKVTRANLNDDIKNLPSDAKEVESEVRQILNDDDSVEAVYITNDGDTIAVQDNVKFIPLNYLQAGNAISVLRTEAEQNLVANVKNAKALQSILPKILDTYRKVSGDENADMDLAIYNLFFNESFFNILLSTANRDVYHLLSHLVKIEEDAVSKTVKDAIYKERVKNSREYMQKSLIVYLINQQEADYMQLNILSRKQKAYIAEKRYSRDLRNRVINGNKLSKADLEVLQNRVNSMLVDADLKSRIMDGIKSSSRASRVSAMSMIERIYNNVFNSPYDGKTYLVNDNIPSAVWNEWAKSAGLTIRTLAAPVTDQDMQEIIREETGGISVENSLAYYKKSFERYSNNTYTFDYKSGVVQVLEIKPLEQRGYENISYNRNAVYSGTTQNKVLVTPKFSEMRKWIKSIINPKLDSVTQGYIDINDIIHDNSLLSESTKKKIQDSKYRTITPQNVFLYLREELINKTGDTTIVLNSDGTFSLATVEPMEDALVKKSINIKSKFPKNSSGLSVSIKSFIKEDYLQGRLSDITVKLSNSSYYDYNTNIIYLDSNSINNNNYARFAILHEFQHAIQVENGMNGGISYNWLETSKITKTQRNKIIADIRKHKPELFKNVNKGSDEELRIAQQYIYDTSGETQAFGIESTARLNDYYPTLVINDVTGSYIVTPWGTKYKLDGAKFASAYPVTYESDLYKIVYELIPQRKYYNWLYRDVNYREQAYSDSEIDRTITDFEDLILNSPEVQEWQGTNIGIRDESKSSVELRKAVFNLAKQNRNLTLRALNMYLAPNVPFNDFLEMEIPFVRVMKGTIVRDADFASAMLGDSVFDSDNRFARILTNTQHNLELQGYDGDVTLYYGLIKPKDIIASIDEGGQEILISTNKLHNADKVKGRIESNGDYFEFKIDENSIDSDISFETSNVKESVVTELNNYIAERLRTDTSDGSFIIMPDGNIIDTRDDIAFVDLDRLVNNVAVKNNLSQAQIRNLKSNTIYVKGGNIIEVKLQHGINATSYNRLIRSILDIVDNNSSDTYISVQTDTGIDTMVKANPEDTGNLADLLTRTADSLNLYDTNVFYPNAPKQPGDISKTRYVSNKEAEDSNLRYFIKKNVPIQLDQRIQSLVKEADPVQTNKSLWKMIGGSEAGTLTVPKLYEYIRNANVMNDYTFNLINKNFFQNTAIKNFKQLVQYSDVEAEKYYAVRAIIRALDKEDLLDKRISPTKFDALLEDIQKRPKWKRMYDDIITRYESYKGQGIVVDRGNMRLLFMKDFEGTIDSAGHIAATAKWLARTGFKIPGQINTTSLEKPTGDETTLEGVIADPDAQEAFNVVLGEESEGSKIDAIVDYRYRTEIFEAADVSKLTKAEVRRRMQVIREKVTDLSPDQLDNAYIAIRYGDADSNAYDAAVNKGVTLVRTRRSIDGNIKRIANNTIRNNLSERDLKRFKEAHPDFFNEDGRFNTNLTKGKTKEQLLEIEDEVRNLSKEVRRGVFKGQMAKSVFSKLQKETERNKRLKARVDKLRQQNKELKLKYSKVLDIKYGDDYQFTINADRDVPEKLSEILDTSFDTFVQSEVQIVSDESDINMQVNMKKFFEINADLFANMTQQDVDLIVDFYAHSEMLMGNLTRNDVRKYDAFEMFTLAYFMQQARQGRFLLTDEQATQINKLLNVLASNSATVLSSWKSALQLADPNRQIVASLAQQSGIKFEETDLDSLTAAMNIEVFGQEGADAFNRLTSTKDKQKRKYKAVQAAIQNLEQKALEQYGKNRPSFFDKLWKFQRLAMLSGPGTMIRNLISNVIVDKGNSLTGFLGNLFTKKFAKNEVIQKTKQWKLVGTKVPESYKNFVDTMFDEILYVREMNGKEVPVTFFEAISDGLNKYDIRRSKNENLSGIDMIVQMISRKVVADIFNEHAFDADGKISSKVGNIINTTSKFVFKMLSDDPWIKKTTKRYMQKMLVEDGINIHQGRTNRTLEILAEAYTMAAWDYMHKQNVFNKVEAVIRDRAGTAGFFVYKQLMPFASASWNWFMEGLNYTPIGLAKGIVQFARLENTIQKMDELRQKGEYVPSSRFATYIAERNIGKGIIGSIGLGIGLILGFTGVAQIDDEDNKLKIRVGTNTYIDITDLFGSQGILVGMAIASPFKGEGSIWDRIKDSIVSTTTQLFNDSAFNDVYSMFQGYNSFGDWLIDQTDGMLQMYIPNAIKTFNSMLYTHKVRYSGGIKGSIERFGVQLVPGLAYALPKKVDPYTGEVMSMYNLNWLVNFINRLGPIDIYPYKVSDYEKIALSLGVKKGELTGRYSDIGNLSPDDVTKLNEYYGKLNTDSLSELFESRVKYRVQDKDGKYVELTYNKMTDEQRKSVIERLMSNNAKYAKIYIYTSNGSKYYATDSEYDELKRLGITNIFRATSKKEGFN